MADPFQVPPSRKIIITEQLDENGQVLFRLPYEESVEIDQGAVRETIRSARFTLANGRSWSTLDLRGDKPVHLGVCDICRQYRLTGKRRLGLTTLDDLRPCVWCGRACCGRHRRKLRGRWFCRNCIPGQRIKLFIMRLLGRWSCS